MEKMGGGMDVEVLYRDAARAYMEAGRTQSAAEALARAALHLEGLDPKASLWLIILNNSFICCMLQHKNEDTMRGKDERSVMLCAGLKPAVYGRSGTAGR